VVGGREGADTVNEVELFGAALGLQAPWRVSDAEFDQSRGRLDLYLDFPRGCRFACPVEGCTESGCPVHDTEGHSWRHLDFFQHSAYLHARVPRVRCAAHGVHQVTVAWARPGSGFTLLFEALLITFAKAMPVARVAAMTGEHDTRIWRVLEHYVATARQGLDFSRVRRVGMDETAAARGQDYVSVFMDLDEAKVLFVTEGRDSATVARFAADLTEHGGDPQQVTDTSSDMSTAFVKGITEHLPNAALTFDRFHVMAKLSEAIDEVRRTEAKTNPLLKGTRYLWLRNQGTLTEAQRDELAWLKRPSNRLATARAHRWREDFQAFYTTDTDTAEAYLRRWCAGAMRSRLEPVKQFVGMVRRHWDGIIAWHRSRISNGLLEGTNSLIQAAKARARGYRSKTKMMTIIYLIAGKLPQPTLTATHTI
jgi:transposase